MIRGASKSLWIVDVDEKPCNEKSVALILQALLDSPHRIYLKFSANILNTLAVCSNSEILELLKTCKQKGCLVSNRYTFPIA
jgi:hypothetical protein